MVVFHAHQSRSPVAVDGRCQRLPDRLRIVAVDGRYDTPAVAPEPPGHVFREPGIDIAVYGDTVVVVQADELAEFERSRKRCRLVGDAFHEAPVAGDRPGAVIDDLVARPD